MTPQMTIYKDEIFGPVLAVVRTERRSRKRSASSTRTSTGTVWRYSLNPAARHGNLKMRLKSGMVGINVPIPIPMAFYSFGGWKASLFGDLHMYGVEGVSFIPVRRNVTERWPKESPAPRA